MPREKGELELSFQVKALVNPCLAEYRAYKTTTEKKKLLRKGALYTLLSRAAC